MRVLTAIGFGSVAESDKESNSSLVRVDLPWGYCQLPRSVVQKSFEVKVVALLDGEFHQVDIGGCSAETDFQSIKVRVFDQLNIVKDYETDFICRGKSFQANDKIFQISSFQTSVPIFLTIGKLIFSVEEEMTKLLQSIDLFLNCLPVNCFISKEAESDSRCLFSNFSKSSIDVEKIVEKFLELQNALVSDFWRDELRDLLDWINEFLGKSNSKLSSLTAISMVFLYLLKRSFLKGHDASILKLSECVLSGLSKIEECRVVILGIVLAILESTLSHAAIKDKTSYRDMQLDYKKALILSLVRLKSSDVLNLCQEFKFLVNNVLDDQLPEDDLHFYDSINAIEYTKILAGDLLQLLALCPFEDDQAKFLGELLGQVIDSEVLIELETRALRSRILGRIPSGPKNDQNRPRFDFTSPRQNDDSDSDDESADSQSFHSSSGESNVILSSLLIDIQSPLHSPVAEILTGKSSTRSVVQSQRFASF